jgi:WhiB family redox-sensing transcriptional regulator
VSVTRVRNAPVVDYSWQSDAACMGANGELFLGPDEERPRDRVRRENLALLVCNACPVRDPCLEHALAVPERHGVWGGTTPEQRLTMRRGGLHVAGEDGLAGDESLAGEDGLAGDGLLDVLGGARVDCAAEVAVAYVPTGQLSARRRGPGGAVSELLQL